MTVYLLSKLFPVPMYSECHLADGTAVATSWWQWRDHCFRIRSWLRPE